MEVKAVEKYIRISPKKARPVADIVRGQRASEALTALRFTPKKGAKVIAKAVKSAVANAEHNFNADKDNLYIKSISIDNGPSLKRFRPRSRGMVSHILKRTSHVTVVVSDETPTVKIPKSKLQIPKKRTEKPVKKETVKTIEAKKVETKKEETPKETK
jgi:large subunit ribosomal protein L22